MFSNTKGISSSNSSKSFIRVTIGNIYRLFDRDASDEKIEEIVDKLEYPTRKLAHFTEYFILGILVLLTFTSFDNKNIYLMILFCFLYAYTDEIHQLFVLGRDGNFIDVLIDTSGSICSIILFKRKVK